MSGFTTIARAFRSGLKPKAARAYLTPLDIHNNDADLSKGDDDTRVFQYFPDTISDSRGVNYSAKTIPGLSHPLYQWISGGPREISFSAFFTRDRALSDDELSVTKGYAGGLNQYGVVAAGITSGTTGIGKITGSNDPRNVDIPSAISWLRSFMDPEYSVDGTGARPATPGRPFPPRKLRLGLPNMRLNWGVPELPADEIYCIMTGCEVSYQSFFADGTPRIASVDLVFAEIIQVAGYIRPHDAAGRRIVARQGYRLTNKNLRGG